MIESTLYKQTLSRFASGITVNTIHTPNNGLIGFTASSFASLSLEPPLIVLCLHYNSECYRPLLAAGRFTTHILAEDQAALAWAFADRTINKAEYANWHINERGYAVLDKALAVLECRLAADHPGGDHAIIVGEVEALQIVDESARPLLYYRSRLGGREVIE